MSGEEAWNFVYSCNKFNDEPDGWYYLLANFEVVFTQDLSNDDSPLELDDFDFDLSTSDFSVSSSKAQQLVIMNWILHFMREQVEVDGLYFVFQKMNYIHMQFFRDNIWFRLNEDE